MKFIRYTFVEAGLGILEKKTEYTIYPTGNIVIKSIEGKSVKNTVSKSVTPDDVSTIYKNMQNNPDGMHCYMDAYDITEIGNDNGSVTKLKQTPGCLFDFINNLDFEWDWENQ